MVGGIGSESPEAERATEKTTTEVTATEKRLPGAERRRCAPRSVHYVTGGSLPKEVPGAAGSL